MKSFFHLFQVMLTELEEKVTGLEKTLRLSEYKVWLVFIKKLFFVLAFLVCCLLFPHSPTAWIRSQQCCRSMTFWCGSGSGSGSADPCFWLMDPDPGSGSCYFRHWPSRCQQKSNFCLNFSAYYFLKVHLHHFYKIKVKKSHKIVGIKVFPTTFAWW